MSVSESDRRAREAFQQLLLRIAPPHALVFDFGAGPGIDARFYADRGFRVAAYDVDPAMCDYFASHCSDLIEAGRVSLERGSYDDFLEGNTSTRGGPVDVVTSNFAPLSLIGNLGSLFARFHSLTAANGKVLASVLNPCFRGDLKYGWWWRNTARLWLHGQYAVPGSQAPIVRRRVAEFASQCAPYFTLQRVYPGIPRNGGADNGLDVSAGGRHPALRFNASQFLFLLFVKRPGVVSANSNTETRTPVQ